MTERKEKRMNLNNLRHYRERKGLTQIELGNRVGLSHAMITYIENGLKDTTGQKWKLIADALDCSVDDLLGKAV